MGPSMCWRLMFRVGNREARDKCLAWILPLFSCVFALSSGWRVKQGHRLGVGIVLLRRNRELLTQFRMLTNWISLHDKEASLLPPSSSVNYSLLFNSLT